MKKLIALVALIGALGLPSFAVRAEAVNAVSPRDRETPVKIRSIDIDAVRAARERLGERTGSVDAVKSATRDERLKRYTDRVIVRLGAFLDMIERFNERVKTLVAQFEQRGRDVTRARADQAVAEKALTEARAAIEALAADLAELTLTEFNRAKVQGEIKRTAETIKIAHRAVVAVIRNLQTATDRSANDTPAEATPTNELLST